MAEDGRLWVETPSREGDGRTLDVYDPDGRYVGSAVTTLPFHPLLPPLVRGDRMWAIVRDEMRVEYIVRARLRPVGEVGGS